MGQANTPQSAAVLQLHQPTRSGIPPELPLDPVEFSISAPAPFPTEAPDVVNELLTPEERIEAAWQTAYSRGIRDGGRNQGQWFTAGVVGGAALIFLLFGAFPGLAQFVLPAPQVQEHQIVAVR